MHTRPVPSAATPSPSGYNPCTTFAAFSRPSAAERALSSLFPKVTRVKGRKKREGREGERVLQYRRTSTPAGVASLPLLS